MQFLNVLGSGQDTEEAWKLCTDDGLRFICVSSDPRVPLSRGEIRSIPENW